MADLVVAVGSSHGPSIQMPPEEWACLADGDTRDPRFDYRALLKAAKPGLDREILLDVQRARAAAARAALGQLANVITQAKLDVVIVVSNPHRLVPTDNHPVFGVCRAESFSVANFSDKAFDPDARFRSDAKKSPSGELEKKLGQPSLANHLITSLIADSFDVACGDKLPEDRPLDDAFAFPYDWLLQDASLPLIPFLLSRYLPNQATPKRCYALGIALRRAIQTWPVEARVGLIASGGLSHQIVDEDLDQQVIGGLLNGNADVLCSLSRDRLNRSPGTPEILNWITVAAAMAPSVMTLVDYQPCYRSVAGTGHGVAFGYWQ